MTEKSVQDYLQPGETCKAFSYDYVEGDKLYKTYYVYDRRKGPYRVKGFVVANQDECVIPREEAIKINVAFNRYNYLYRLFHGEWNKIVQQDLRKIETGYHYVLKTLEYLAEQRAENMQLELDHASEQYVTKYISQAEAFFHYVLNKQKALFSLDYQAIELGKTKRKHNAINQEIIEEVNDIFTRFETTYFEQVKQQIEHQAFAEEFIHFISKHKLAKPLRKGAKKIKSGLKRILKHNKKQAEWYANRKDDPANKEYYSQLEAQWTEQLRNA